MSDHKDDPKTALLRALGKVSASEQFANLKSAFAENDIPMNSRRTLMWRYIREKLATGEILYSVNDMARRISRLEERQLQLEKQVVPLLAGLGRVIAKLEPTFGTSEFDQKRREESDELADQVLRRLKAEEEARKHNDPLRGMS